MKSLKIYSLIILGVLSFGLVSGQQFTDFNLYEANRILLNPANTGDQGQTVAFMNVRNQWTSLNGSPTTMAFGVHGSLNDNMGLGSYVISEKTGLMNTVALNLNYAYTAKLGEEHFLDFGLGANIFQNRIDFDQVQVNDPNDKVIMDYADKGTTLDFSFGINYAFKRLQVGAGMFQLAGNGITYTGLEDDLTLENYRTLKAYVSYDFEISEKFDLEPMLLVRNASNIHTQFDLNAIATWNELVWLGVGYRNSGNNWLETENGGENSDFDLSLDYSSLLLSGGLILNKNLRFGYGYEVSNSEIYSHSNGTHEISLVYYFNRGKKDDRDDSKLIELINKNHKDVIGRVDSVSKDVKENKEITQEIVENNEEQDERLETIEEQLKDRPAPVTQVISHESSYIDPINIIYFPSGKDNIDNAARIELRKILIYLIKNPEATATVVGHANDVGSSESNRVLSERRAMQVVDYFVENTIDRNRLTVVVKGESDPIIPTQTDEGRSINRSVEVIIDQD